MNLKNWIKKIKIRKIWYTQDEYKDAIKKIQEYKPIIKETYNA